ncbi:MAG TPA: hypothetical protein VFI29_08645 [Hanamia sp.]|nr:hypothetical protein [Hanamia sp.]
MEYKELPEDICEALLIELFQSIPELLPTIAPDGFANSPLVLIFHPTPEQRYKEYCRMSENIAALQKAGKQQIDVNSIVSFEEFIKDIKSEPVDEQYEMVSIFGDCIWNIFSNNHTVYNENGESYDLGSWRGSGRFIADVINKLELVPGKFFDYMDFYMGHIFTQERTDITQVYEFIFKILKEKNLDWEYSFPRMGLVSFEKDEEENNDIENYDPSEAMKQRLEKEQQRNEINKLQQNFDEMYEAEYEEARFKKPSPEVLAYYNIYQHYPKGHPLAEN